jgi:hypothetical protein
MYSPSFDRFRLDLIHKTGILRVLTSTSSNDFHSLFMVTLLTGLKIFRHIHVKKVINKKVVHNHKMHTLRPLQYSHKSDNEEIIRAIRVTVICATSKALPKLLPLFCRLADILSIRSDFM